VTGDRLSHAALDPESRSRKARKIEALLGGAESLRGLRILDVGAGSGVIANHLAGTVGREGEVCAVDVNDERVVTDGYRFERIHDTSLPFEDGAFDVVLSNHVIEHVGTPADQARHLAEVRRVLAPGGRCYLAVPNRWVVIEPHFRLPFLSWLPRGLRSPYVRLAGRGTHYDCEIPTREQLLRLVAAAGFRATDATIAAMRVLLRVERPSGALRLVLDAPESVLRPLLPIAPTTVLVLRPAAGRSSTGPR
jgi:SAM-dependent methyltransferase